MMSKSELDAWEKINNFSSLRSIYNKAVEQETRYFDKLESIGEESLDINKVKPHADYVLENSAFFRFDEMEGWFELNIANQELAPLLNKDGIIVINNLAIKYTQNSMFVTESFGVDKLREIKDENYSSPGVKKYDIILSRKKIGKNTRVVTGSFPVNKCTGTADRYRVILYEDVITYFVGPTGTFALDHTFKAKSFRRTVFGWQRNFETSFLAASVSYQATWGIDGKYIQANGPQSEISWTFISGYQYSEHFPPEIFYSTGQGWGRNGCTCTYTGYY